MTDVIVVSPQIWPAIVESVLELTGTPQSVFARRGGRAGHEARAIAAYVAVTELEVLSQVEAAKLLGRCQSNVSRSQRRIEDLREDPRFDETIERLAEGLRRRFPVRRRQATLGAEAAIAA